MATHHSALGTWSVSVSCNEIDLTALWSGFASRVLNRAQFTKHVIDAFYKVWDFRRFQGVV